jgi:threonine dehydrogenase-like Zn-dependent dehydrogenase
MRVGEVACSRRSLLAGARLTGMRAAVARNRAIVVDDIDDPVAGSGEALVRVRACGICGSDLHALVHADELVDAANDVGVPMLFDPRRDYVMGHEFAAEVLELGPSTEGAPVGAGDLVTSLPIALTANGMEPVGSYSNTYNGGYAELMRLTAGICLKVPNGLDARRAALTEPMAVGRHAVARGGVGEQDAAIVHGAGPVGLAVIAELHRLGVNAIVASDFSPRRRATALAMGATLAVDPASDDPIDAWRRGGGGGTPVIFDAIGVPGSLGLAFRSAPAMARVVVVGSCMQQDTIRPVLPQLKQLTVIFSFAYDPFEFADTLRAIAEGEIDVTPMITGTCGLDGVGDAFTALGSPDDHVKILVEPGAAAAIVAV